MMTTRAYRTFKIVWERDDGTPLITHELSLNRRAVLRQLKQGVITPPCESAKCLQVVEDEYPVIDLMWLTSVCQKVNKKEQEARAPMISALCDIIAACAPRYIDLEGELHER